jgi:uncharacterized SAM-binding protein YcdF (DUF218 family)
MLNDLLSNLDLAAWKPLLTALLLPPAPFVALLLWGALRLSHRRRGGWLLVGLAAAGIWFGGTALVGDALQHRLWPAPAAAWQDIVAEPGAAASATAIVVLGGGREREPAEYGASNLNLHSLARLRYALWLARRSELPVAYSGGVGHAQGAGEAEATIAARIARDEFALPLAWTESASRDTRENAALTVSMLREAGVQRIVLVTHGWHMRRSLRAFEGAIARTGGGIAVVPAPMGLASSDLSPLLRWLPSNDGMQSTRTALREMLALLVGA